MNLSGENVANYDGIFYFMKMLSKHLGEMDYFMEDSVASSVHPHLREFSEKLENAVYHYKYENIEDYYFNMGIKKSSEYATWLERYTNYMWDIGLGSSEGYFTNEGSHAVYVAGLPCEDDYLFELEETSDYWWFLVSVIQKFSSPCEQGWVPNMWEIEERVEETYKNFTGDFSFDWFLPLKNYITAVKLAYDYKNKTMKSVSLENFSNLDFSLIKPADLSNIPEYDIEDSFIHHNGKYYEIMDVFLAITASGGMAQALERQDLEPKVTTVHNILKRKNKEKK